jgi:capsid protein
MIFKNQNGQTSRPFDGRTADPETGFVEMEFSEAMIKDIGNKDVVIDRAKFPNEMYGEYLRLMEQRIGTGVEMDYPHISGDLSQTNFSSARFGAANTQEAFRGIQLLLIEQFLEPMAEDWMKMAFLKNQIVLESGAILPSDRFEKFVDGITFTGRTWGFIQPLQDIMAATVAIEYGLQSPIEWFEERGKDMYEVYNDLKTAKDLRDKLGIGTKLDALDKAMQELQTATPGTKAEKITQGLRTLADVLIEIDDAENSNDPTRVDVAEEKLLRQAREILRRSKNGHHQPT